MRRLVVQRQGDRVEHVLPIALFPAPVLRQIDAKRRIAVCDSDCHLRLLGLAVAGDGRADGLRRVHREVGMLTGGKVLGRPTQPVELVEPRHRVPVCLFDHHDVRPVRP